MLTDIKQDIRSLDFLINKPQSDHEKIAFTTLEYARPRRCFVLRVNLQNLSLGMVWGASAFVGTPLCTRGYGAHVAWH